MDAASGLFALVRQVSGMAGIALVGAIVKPRKTHISAVCSSTFRAGR